MSETVLDRVFLFLLLATCATCQWVSKFDTCRDNAWSILNGTGQVGDLDRNTMYERGYVYTGPVGLLKPEFDRSEILTLTYSGKLPGRHLSTSAKHE